MSRAHPAVVRAIPDLRAHVAAWRERGERVALVPTMGALHEGHLSLVRIARARAQRVVTSLFINPTQFAAHEDLGAYPRQEARDIALLAAEGCDLVYAPTAGEMYPQGFATAISVAGVSEPLDGIARPHHFGGVATVVAKLLIQCGPDIAVFGEKDYQQLQIIRRMAADLDLPVEIVGGPTVRAEDGLALSSRNAYLTEAQRPIAGRLNVILSSAAAALAGGAPIAAVEADGLSALIDAGFDKVDYFEVRDADDLSRPEGDVATRPTRIFVAARLGKARLIDNMAVTPIA